jgi:S1-C subfamily serine protease
VTARGAALGLALAAAPPSPAASPEPPHAAASLDEARAAIVQVVTIRRDGETRVPRGSAFFVSAQGYLLTCAHVVDHMPGDEAARVRWHDGREQRFEVVHVDREVDLALLRSAPPESFLSLAEPTLPSAGDAVLLAGYPVRGDRDGASPRFKPGRVVGLERRRISGVRRAVASRRTILSVKVDEIADAGQSGGPLLEAGTFAAAGVIRANLEKVTGGLERARPVGSAVAVPILYVGPFLRPYLD